MVKPYVFTVIILCSLVVTRQVGYLRKISQIKEGITVKAKITVRDNLISLRGVNYLKSDILYFTVPDNINLTRGDNIQVIGNVESRLTGDFNVLIVKDYSQFSIIGHTNNPLDYLTDWRKAQTDKLLHWLTGDEGVLAGGIVFGGDAGFTWDGKENFRKAGISHVMAASGYNVTVIAGWAMSLAGHAVGKRKAIYFGIVCCGIYAVTAGLTGAVVRAAIMSGLSLTAMSLGRKTAAWWLLGLAGAVMLITQPAWLYDIGWQLSTAATAGILVSQGMSSSKGINWFRSELITTTAASLATLPLILKHFGTVSPVAPITNLAVTWTIPPIMQLAAGAVLVGQILPSAGQIIALVGWPLTKYVTMVAGLVSKLPGANWELKPVSWVFVVGCYGALIGFVWLAMRRKGVNESK